MHGVYFISVLTDFMLEVKRNLNRQDQRLQRIERSLEYLVTKDAPGNARRVVQTVLDGPVESVEALHALDDKLKHDDVFSDKLVSNFHKHSWYWFLLNFFFADHLLAVAGRR
jgi:hypothetical protein